MENTSKALLIAAAVLIVIILITLGVKIFSSPKDIQQQAETVGESISSSTKDAIEQLQSSFDKTGIGGTASGDNNPSTDGNYEEITGETEVQTGKTVPEGATYTLKLTGEVLQSGSKMPLEPQPGDLYTYGDYMYGYKIVWHHDLEWEIYNLNEDGWRSFLCKY